MLKSRFHVPFSRTVCQLVHNYKVNKALDTELKKDNYVFSIERRNIVLYESKDWGRFYLPVNVVDKVVLDAGAGEGETARFYLKYGARKVVAVEPDPQCYELLVRNAEKHPEIVPVNKKFDTSMLAEYAPDLLKCDIEGYEEQLLSVKLSCVAAVEVHGLQLRDKFKAAGYDISYSDLGNMRGYGCTSYAIWRPK